MGRISSPNSVYMYYLLYMCFIIRIYKGKRSETPPHKAIAIVLRVSYPRFSCDLRMFRDGGRLLEYDLVLKRSNFTMDVA